MDNIWENAARKARACNKRVATSPIANSIGNTANTTTFPAATNKNLAALPALTEEDLNTVEKIDAQLAHMEQNWAQTQSGPFPERAQNAIVRLRASLEEQHTETIPPSQPTDPAVDV